VRDRIIEIIEEAGDRDGIPGLYTIEEAADAILAQTAFGRKWEYYILDGRVITGSLLAHEIALNHLGKDGWELMAVTSDRIAYFKRPKEDDGKLSHDGYDEARRYTEECKKRGGRIVMVAEGVGYCEEADERQKQKEEAQEVKKESNQKDPHQSQGVTHFPSPREIGALYSAGYANR
jgi:hypothetical protein